MALIKSAAPMTSVRNLGGTTLSCCQSFSCKGMDQLVPRGQRTLCSLWPHTSAQPLLTWNLSAAQCEEDDSVEIILFKVRAPFLGSNRVSQKTAAACSWPRAQEGQHPDRVRQKSCSVASPCFFLLSYSSFPLQMSSL